MKEFTTEGHASGGQARRGGRGNEEGAHRGGPRRTRRGGSAEKGERRKVRGEGGQGKEAAGAESRLLILALVRGPATCLPRMPGNVECLPRQHGMQPDSLLEIHVGGDDLRTDNALFKHQVEESSFRV